MIKYKTHTEIDWCSCRVHKQTSMTKMIPSGLAREIAAGSGGHYDRNGGMFSVVNHLSLVWWNPISEPVWHVAVSRKFHGFVTILEPHQVVGFRLALCFTNKRVMEHCWFGCGWACRLPHLHEIDAFIEGDGKKLKHGWDMLNSGAEFRTLCRETN